MDQTENGSPPSPLLQKWQRNSIFTAIEKAGLDPNGFSLDDSGILLRIKHRQSGSYFTISGHAGCYAGDRVVGDGPNMPYTGYSWDAVKSRAETWAQETKRDLDIPDLWAELQRDAKLLEAASDDVTDNTPFAPEEQRAIAARFEGLANEIGQAFSLSAEQTRFLGVRIEGLVKDSRRLGRKDWLNNLIAVILGYALSVALPPDSMRVALVIALRTIGILYPELPSDT